MRRYSNRTSLSTLSEINITPLLDLAFVLLIIFMITTPLLENSKTLIIPSSGTTNAPINPAAVQTLSIDRNEVVRLNERGGRPGDAREPAGGVESGRSKRGSGDSPGPQPAGAKTR